MSEKIENKNSEPIIETQNLTKRFGGLVAVDNINFQVLPGEVRCIIGPNGAGKSTLFNLLINNCDPTEGKIFFKNKNITDLMTHQRVQEGISIKSQDPSVYSDLTITKNLEIPLYKNNDIDKKERIENLLDIINLKEKRYINASELSHGKKQWLEIAMAIADKPDLLLLDEPTAGMTSGETSDTINLIKRLARSGISIVVIEHNMNFVRDLADNITVLHNGSILKEGSMSEIESDKKINKIYLGGN